jgi:hypothetical protein
MPRATTCSAADSSGSTTSGSSIARSRCLPGGHLEQADGTAWMAFFCGSMLFIALELASEDPAYEDVASKFFEHYIAISDAMNSLGGSGLWDEVDGFYYDQLHVDHQRVSLRIRSMVGIIPLFVVGILEEDVLARLPGFQKRLQWFIDNRPDLAHHIVSGSFVPARAGPQAATVNRWCRGACSPSHLASVSYARCATCSMRTSSCHHMASDRCHAFTPSIRSCSMRWG